MRKLFSLVVVLFACSLSMFAQQTVSGIVVDTNGDPIIGAAISEVGTTSGTISDFNGQFTLQVAKDAQLRISYVGYKAVTLKAVNGMRVVLQEDNTVLDELVVVGYGVQKKANLTGAVSTVDVGKTLESKSQANVTKALQGAVPGLTITQVNGDINEDATVQIRGIGSVNGNSRPLYVIDGIPMDVTDNFNPLASLNANDIESISVLKDAASTSIYGTKAAFGVVLITTKSAKDEGKFKVSYSNNFGWSQATVLPTYSNVARQAEAMLQANDRNGDASELFGIYFDKTSAAGQHFWEMVGKWQAQYGENYKKGYEEIIDGVDYDELGYYADWDVAGIFFNNAAPSQQHNLSISGNTGKTQYYLSLGYDHEQSLANFRPDKLNKYNATINVQSQVKSWLTVGGRFSYSDKNFNSVYARGAGTYQYLWRWGSFFGPYGYFVDANGDKWDARTMIGGRNTGGDITRRYMSMRANGFFKIDFSHGFTFNADYTFVNSTSRYKGDGLPSNVYNTWSLYPTAPSNIAGATTWVETDRSFAFQHIANAYFNYNNSFNNVHNLNVMIGGNLDKYNYEYLYFETHAIMDPNMPELALSNEMYNYSHAKGKRGSLGLFGRINYDYKGIYLLELNGRYDWSSKFPDGSKGAFFPSFSAGYRISEEAYYEPAKQYVSNLKVRASYGTIGNSDVGSNMFLATMSKQTNGVNWLGTGSSKYDTFSQPKLVGSSLTWETIATTNVGIDLGFLNNALNVSFDWFQRENRNMIAPGKAMPAVLGASAAYENAGSMRSRGWELTIDWRQTFGDWTVYATANLNDYKTVVTEWDSNNLIGGNYTGKEYGEIWGFETDRYFTAEDFVGGDPANGYAAGIADQTGLQSGKFVYGIGDIKFVDQNGDGKIDAGKGTPEDHGDLIKIGNFTPRFQYSLRAGFDYNINKGKGGALDLDLYFQGVGKRDMWTQSSFVMPFMRGVDGIYAHQMSYVTQEMIDNNTVDQSVKYPALYGGGAGLGTISSSVLNNGRYNFYPQTKYLVNMAYLRLKNVTIGYTLPRDITRKAYIEKIRIYGSINNACDLVNHTRQYGLDPEINTGVGSYANGVWGRTEPITRTYSFGVQVEF
ncbi:MAG: TonB-dependent receptor [Paludibacteraceae bacterium]|nr:TonB-dependent receptor [Paludibacteraceae bacterium]